MDSMGVNTHLGYLDTAYNNYPLIKDKLSALGVRHVRDEAIDEWWRNEKVYDRYKQLADLGIKSNLIVDLKIPSTNTIDPEKINRIAAMAGPALESFEGPNEHDLKGGGDWASALRAYQRDLYAAVEENPSTSEAIPVLGPSLTSREAYDEIGNLSASVDYGNIHNYYAGRHPGSDGWGADGYGSLAWHLDNTRTYVSLKPTVSTETGYHNAVPSTNEHPGTPEAVAGKYIPRIYLEHFNRGIFRTYVYEFIDEKPDPEFQDPEQHFGLLRNDGSEKPAYTALKNLIFLLKEEPGPAFVPESLGYSLSGDDTENIHRTLLQKRDGRFYLILWQEVPGYDPDAQREIPPVPDKMVTLAFDQPVEQATTYLTNFSTTPVEQHDAPEQLALYVPDHPLVVEITPVPDS